MTYDDDRPGMIRVHIAHERAIALCNTFTRDQLRSQARGLGLSTASNKRELALAIVIERNSRGGAR